MKNLVLVGFMGSGKTTVGKLVARELGMKFVDMDSWIAKYEGYSISKIFELKGEAVFRDLESKAANELAAQQNLVIATGGGVVLKAENIKALQNTGILIYLHIDEPTVLIRTAKDTARPLLRGDNRMEQIRSLLKERQPLYDAIPNRIETVGHAIPEIVQEAVNLYRKKTESS